MSRASGTFRPADEVAKDYKTFQARYPMYVISVPTFLRLGSLVEHRHLYQQGLLTEWVPGLRVICVSHQWLGNSEPDPTKEHYQVLTRSLERLMSGDVPSVTNYWMHRMFSSRKAISSKDWQELSTMHIWVDYCCMPQVNASSSQSDMRAAGKAVQSLPAYFERSALMLVLAPVCRHLDTGRICNYATWRRRGWCRMELACATLAPQDVPVMIVNGGESTPFTIHAFDTPRLLPGHGEFSCCRLNHILNGRPIPCDREKCGSVLEKMMSAKSRQLLKGNRRLEHHYWVSVWWSFLEGLQGDKTILPTLLNRAAAPHPAGVHKGPQIHSSVEAAAAGTAARVPLPLLPQPRAPAAKRGIAALIEKLSWSEEDERSVKKTGFSLAHCAALANDAQAIREMAAKGGVNFNLPLKVTMFHLAYMVQDVTPLMLAMTFASFETVEALLDAKADPHQRNSNAMDALFLGCCRGQTANVAAWLKRFPDWEVDRNDRMLGISPVCLNALTGVNKAQILENFIDHGGIDFSKKGRWGGEHSMLCFMALCEDPDLRAVELLLEQGCDPSGQWHSSSRIWRMVFKAFRLRSGRGGQCQRWTHEMALFEGSAPLHLACKRGDAELVSMLVLARADVEAKNAQGCTPLQVAERFFGEVPALLAQALDPATAPAIAAAVAAEKPGASAEEPAPAEAPEVGIHQQADAIVMGLGPDGVELLSHYLVASV